MAPSVQCLGFEGLSAQIDSLRFEGPQPANFGPKLEFCFHCSAHHYMYNFTGDKGGAMRSHLTLSSPKGLSSSVGPASRYSHGTIPPATQKLMPLNT